MNKQPTSFRLSDEAKVLIDKIARRLGLTSRVSVIEFLIREKADQLGLRDGGEK